jgi:hypothetical protein
MSMFDNMKDKAGDMADEHGQQMGEGADKAGDFIDEKTGGRYSEQIDSGVEKGKDTVDNLDNQDDDIP